MTYRPPNGDIKEFEKHLNKILSTIDILKKEVVTAGDFNMDLLNFKQNKNVQNFVNVMFRHSLIPVINNLTHVTKNTATDVDHISSTICKFIFTFLQYIFTVHICKFINKKSVST